jgi:hypothetical protein
MLPEAYFIDRRFKTNYYLYSRIMTVKGERLWIRMPKRWLQKPTAGF